LRVFISYSAVDEPLAREIQSTLENVGVGSFLDKKDIAWGDDVLERVARGLSDSAAVIVIVSPASLKSQWVPFEVGHAMALGKKVLPFLAHPSMDVPDFLRKLNHKTNVGDVRAYFAAQLEATRRMSSASSGQPSPKERDAIRAARNELLENRMRVEPGVASADVFQIDDHTDNGFVLFVQFDDSKTSAGKLVARVRELFEELFPDVPVWGEMKVEEDTSIGFVFTYLDKWNRRARTG
jgi:hypothetical protein